MVSTPRAISASAFDERLQALAHHVGGQRGHARNIDGQVDDRHLLHAAHAVADALGGVAHALQVGVDLDHAQDEAQVDGHGLLHGQQVERGLVDVALQAVDGDFAAAHQVADGQIAHAIGLNGALDGLLGQPGHHQQILLQIVEALLKAYACHPNLPVM